jgi:hypothetical protein
MHLDAELSQKHCARCHHKLTAPAHYQDEEWYHLACWQKGAHEFADATHISEAVQHMQHLFPPLYAHDSITPP